MVIYNCENCKYTTNKKPNLTRHIPKCKGFKNYKYKCTWCIYATNDKSNLNKHLKTCKFKEETEETEETEEVEEIEEIEEVKENEVKEKEVKEKKRKNLPASLRYLVWNTYITREIGVSKCVCCKTNEISQQLFECGHIISRSNGGSDFVENLRPICALCNKSMGTMNMIEFLTIIK